MVTQNIGIDTYVLFHKSCVFVHKCMSTFICSIMCNYSKVYMVTSKMLNLCVGVHQKVRRQLLYVLYSDNIFVSFHIHIFHAVSKIQCLCTKTSVDNSVTKLWPNLENHFVKIRILKKFILKKSISKNPFLPS